MDSTKKISVCKIIVLKNTFENLNSSEMMLKILKTIKIYF
jgi:hypothetical protein